MGATDFTPVYNVRVKIQPVTVGDDSGLASCPSVWSEGPQAVQERLVRGIEGVNRIWRQAGVKFLFDPAQDLLPLQWNTALRDGDPAASLQLARQYPRAIMVIWTNLGTGMSSGTSPVVRVHNDFHPGHVAHEIGHFLHLEHTFHEGFTRLQAKARDLEGAPIDWDTVKGVRQYSAEEQIRTWVRERAQEVEGARRLASIPAKYIEGGLQALDFDTDGIHGVADTPPHFHGLGDIPEATVKAIASDPGARIAINVQFNRHQEHTYYWQPDYNLLSYWHGVTYKPDPNGPEENRATLSAQQVNRARFMLSRGNRARVGAPAGYSGLRWAGWTIVNENAWAHESPGLAALRDRLYLFWRSETADGPPGSGELRRIFGMSLEEGPCFERGAFEVQGDGRTHRGLAATSQGDVIHVLALGLEGRVYGNRATWMKAFSGWDRIGEDFYTDYPPAAATLGANRYAFAVRRGDGTIHVSSAPASSSWGPWAEVQGNGRTDAAVAATALKGRLYLAARGLDGYVYLNSAADGYAFGGWTRVPGNLRITGRPALASDGQRLVLAALGTTAIHHQVSNMSGVFAGGWEQLPYEAGSYTSAAGWSLQPPTAAALPTVFGDTVFIATIGADRRIYLNWTY